MSQLVIEGFTVRVADGTSLSDSPWGDFGRAFSGKARSDRRAEHRTIPVTTVEMDPTDALALRLLIQSPGSLKCSGDRIGTETEFHARNYRERYLPGGEVIAQFELHETDSQPAELLFTLHGDALGSYTFTRSGAVGPYTGSDGLLTDAAANIPRQEWVFSETLAGSLPDEAWLLLECQPLTNLVASDNMTTWGTSGSPTVTGSVSDPAGGTGAYTIEDPGGSQSHLREPVTFTGDSAKVAAFAVRENTMASAGVQAVEVFDASAITSRGRLEISAWSNGEPTVAENGGTYLGKRYIGNGYWVLYLLTTSVTAANTNQVRIYPAYSNPGDTGIIDAFRVNAFNSTSPVWSMLDAGETKNAEALSYTFAPVPQAMSGLVDLRELQRGLWGQEGGANRRVLHIGDANDARLFIDRPDGLDHYRIVHDPGVSSVTSSIDISPSWGDRIQLFWWLYSDGSVNIAGRKQALGSSTWSSITTGSQSSGVSLAATWSSAIVQVGAVDGVGRGSQLYRSVSVLKGSGYSTAELLNFRSARLHRRAA